MFSIIINLTVFLIRLNKGAVRLLHVCVVALWWLRFRRFSVILFTPSRALDCFFSPLNTEIAVHQRKRNPNRHLHVFDLFCFVHVFFCGPPAVFFFAERARAGRSVLQIFKTFHVFRCRERRRHRWDHHRAIAVSASSLCAAAVRARNWRWRWGRHSSGERDGRVTSTLRCA